MITHPLYLLHGGYEDVNKLVKVRLNISPEDTRYDEQISKAVLNNLIKISRLPLPILMHNFIYLEATASTSMNIYQRFMARVHNVALKHDHEKDTCWVKLRPRGPYDRDPTETENPEIYEWSEGQITPDVYPEKGGRSKQSLVIEYDGLPPYDALSDIIDGKVMTPRTFRPEFDNLLLTGTLRDLYRDVLKAPDLFTLADSTWNEEYASLREKDLSPYPKTLKTPKTYW